MQHYFIDKEHIETDFFDFKDTILDYEFCFRSCDSIFSKNKIDDGTRTLINAIAKHVQLSGECLDLGCGLGCLAIPLIRHFRVFFDMIDINKTAVNLAKQNLIKNNLQKNGNVFYSNGFEMVDKIYDYIITNPPIKTGKELLFSLMQGSFEHLKNGGTLILVVRKDHGMESLKKHVNSVFGNCEILERNKGYYILKAVKQ